ncbi:GGDEF domain-containing protein [Vibrio makurazakiensis]|uniref:GGDEF domain-containing protein n=1 Tax=Vibrio makurazakiensis TaxID=2910250 RepID=UPI003D0AF976
MKWIHKVIFIFVILTIAIVQLYRVNGDRKVLTISPKDYTFFATNDQGEGGKSTSDLKFESGAYILECELIKSDYPWPYCGLSIHIDPDSSIGIDLSQYHTFKVNIDYVQSGTGEGRLRAYLRNFNPAYSTVENEYTHKYNGMEYQPGIEQGKRRIPIDNLQVMTWWLADNKIEIEHSAPEYSNINKIEFATGSSSTLGKHRIVIKSIEFEGAYMKAENLFLMLLALWVTVAMTYVLTELYRTRKAIMLSERRHSHLENVNKTLRAQNLEFAELAHRDALTGAMNRHAIRDWVKGHSKSVESDDSSMSVLYLDIDFFKAINDKYGHKMGDNILKEFCMVVSNEVRSKDRLARWGGEEFIVFLPNTGIDQASQIAERICRQVSQHIWVHGDALTCSIGVVTETGKEKITETITRADEALYQAKQLGRNRVEVSAIT